MSEPSSYDEFRDAAWWPVELTDDERADKLIAMVRAIRASQQTRKDADYARLRSYTTGPMMGFGMAAAPRTMTSGTVRRISLNVIKNVSDAFTATVTKDRPKVSFVTEGGDWGLQQKARSLEKFIEGQFYECGVYEMAPQIVLDGGGIFGKGFFKVYIAGENKKARIKVERVFPWEILVDEQEGLYGEAETPRMYQEKWIDRLILLSQYKDDDEKREAIKRASRDTQPNTGVGYNSKADQLLVTEGWSLPTADGEKDGRHTIAIQGCTLEDEVWEWDFFPFVTYSKQPAPVGYWGISICDNLDGIQCELNTLLMRVQTAMRLLGAAHVLVHSQAKVNFAQWDNGIGTKIGWSGSVKPEVFVPTMLVPPEVYEQIVRLNEWAYEVEGIPKTQAEGNVPDNFDSGKAIDRYMAVTDRRIQVAIHRYHQMFLNMAKVMLELGRKIAEKNPEYGVKAAIGKGGMRKIFLKQNDLREDEYVLKMWPTQALADDPGQRMMQVEKMANAGWVAPDQAKRLLDFPDLEEANDLENASYNAVEDVIQEMLQEGRYNAPQPYLNLEQAKKQVQLALVKAWRDHVAEDRQQLLRDWLQDAADLAGIGQPQMPQTMASVGGTPVLAARRPARLRIMAGRTRRWTARAGRPAHRPWPHRKTWIPTGPLAHPECFTNDSAAGAVPCDGNARYCTSIRKRPHVEHFGSWRYATHPGKATRYIIKQLRLARL